ncbi:hypothetical protein LHGZ1_1096 [Laribacter hongkongensis]|uniref:Uncharacterized protein n=1 Tax=Laribacter hongkongensis TaxID=168471 RepID=A0A248LGP9_9NEIS|nr:hypothetical protein LHGZ1_1096 [Laribacter hongkongensis]
MTFIKFKYGVKPCFEQSESIAKKFLKIPLSSRMRPLITVFRPLFSPSGRRKKAA